MAERESTEHRHLTTRPAFVTGLGFLGVSLYLLWAVYGAAPTSLPFLAETGDAAGGAEHMHGAPGAGGMSVEEFARLAEAFLAANRLPDGSVRPTRSPITGVAADAGSHGAARGREAEEARVHGSGTPAHVHEAAAGGAPVGEGPVDVYLTAFRYGYEPDVLRLERGVPYRFRMMAVDAYHGASIAFGWASRLIRLAPGRLVEQEMRFLRPGEYTVYCTVYCGLGHDLMRARIIVEEPQKGTG